MPQTRPTMTRVAGYELDALLGRTFVTLADEVPFMVTRYQPDEGLGGTLTLRCVDGLDGRTKIDVLTFSRAVRSGAITEA